MNGTDDDDDDSSSLPLHSSKDGKAKNSACSAGKSSMVEKRAFRDTWLLECSEGGASGDRIGRTEMGESGA